MNNFTLMNVAFYHVLSFYNVHFFDGLDGLRVSLAYYEDKWLSREILQNPYDKSLFERTNACTDRHKVNKLKNNVCLILLIIKTLH